MLAGNPVRSTSLNRFVYSLGNPVRYVDPSGLDSSDTVSMDVSMDLTSTCCDGGGGGDYVPSFSDWVADVFAQVSWAFDYGAYDAYFNSADLRVAGMNPKEGDDPEGEEEIPFLNPVLTRPRPGGPPLPVDFDGRPMNVTLEFPPVVTGGRGGTQVRVGPPSETRTSIGDPFSAPVAHPNINPDETHRSLKTGRD